MTARRRGAAGPRLALGLLALAIGLTGCPKPPPELADLTPLPLADPRVAAAEAALAEGAGSRQALRGVAKVSLRSPDRNLSRPQRIAVRRPADLRVEIVALFGQLGAVLVTDGRDYQLWQAGSEGLVEGPVDPGLLWQVARVDLEPDEAAMLLLAAPLPDPGLPLTRAALGPDEAVWLVFQDVDGLREQRFAVDAEGRLLKAERRIGEAIVWSARYDAFREVGNASFPYQLRLAFPTSRSVASFVFSRVDLNPELPDAMFRLELP